MKAYKQQFLEYWSQRSPREQRLLAAMAAVLGAALLYLAVWEPASSSLQRNRVSAARLQAELGAVSALADEAAKLDLGEQDAAHAGDAACGPQCEGNWGFAQLNR